MAKENILEFDATAGNNTDVDSVSIAEGMNASGVNNAIRALMALLKEFYTSIGGAQSTAGSSNAYTLTSGLGGYNLTDGSVVSATANHASTGAATLNVDSAGAKAIRVVDATGERDTATGDIIANGHYIWQYDSALDGGSGAWMLLNPSLPDLSGYQTQGDVLDDLNTLGAAASDGEIIVATGAGAFAYESGATARTSLGVGTGDSPQFTGIELGHASDTTLTRTGAGTMAVEGVEVTTNTATQTLTNKTLTSPVINVTSDAQGDVYYRNGSGVYTRLAIGSANEVLTVNSGATAPEWAAASGGDMILVASATASNDATIDFTGLSSTYHAYLLVCEGVIPATDGANPGIRTSTNGGSSYDSGASDYQSSVFGGGTDSTFRIYDGSNGVGSAAGESWGSHIWLYNPSSTEKTPMSAVCAYWDTGGIFRSNEARGFRDSAADVDAFQFLFSSGNVSAGNFRLYGLAAS